MRAQLEEGTLQVDAPLGRLRRTLLHIAVMTFRPDLVELLVDYGADPRVEDAAGLSAYALAVELRDLGRASGAEVLANSEGLVERMAASAAILEYEHQTRDFMENGLLFDDVAAPVGAAPPSPSPLIRLTSTGRSIKPPPPPPPPPSITRGVTVDGAESTATHADLSQAMEALGRRLDEGAQVFSDIGLWCVMQLQERSSRTVLRKLQRGIEGSKEVVGANVGSEPRCGICLEAGSTELITAPCGRLKCSGRFCKECLTTYFQHCVGELRYALPLVRCPTIGCRRRVPTQVWAHYLTAAGEKDVQQRITRAGEALLKVRCPACHTPRDLFRFSPKVAEREADDTALGDTVLQGLDATRRLRMAKEAETFRSGGLAQHVLDVLDFTGDAVADPATGEVVSVRLPQPPPPDLEERFQGLCGLLGDPERAASMQLAFYRRYPLIRTQCCKSEMCFKCKVRGHHPGMTCEERQASELSIEAQYCPGCGVPTVKSEGCDHIVCVCGASWQWRKNR